MQFAAVAAPRRIKSSVVSSIKPSPQKELNGHFAAITNKTKMGVERLQDSKIRDKQEINVRFM
jgi:hypothetical protein